MDTRRGSPRGLSRQKLVSYNAGLTARGELETNMNKFLRDCFLRCCYFAGAVLSPMSASPHSGDSVVAPAVSSAPVFEPTGQHPRGCDVFPPSAYSRAARVQIDPAVTVFILHTDSDLYFCFTGIEARNSTPLTEPNHQDGAWVFLDIDHAGSSKPTNRHYLFHISPTSLVTVSSASFRGPTFQDPGPAQDAGPPNFTTNWSARGVDAQTGEFVVAWNAELRVSRDVLGAAWHTVGLRLAYNVGVPFVTHQTGAWPKDSNPLDPSTWGDLILSGAGKAMGILTNNADNARTGSYREDLLSPSNIFPGSAFGKRHTWEVDGQIYAQPLYVRGLAMPDGSIHNVVLVATEKNHVYAFDTDTFATLWHVTLGAPVPADEVGCNNRQISPPDPPHRNLDPFVGITSTPVVDLNINSMYVVVKTGSAPDYSYMLHMLDLATGQSKMATLMLRGTRALHHLNRPGLLLSNGKVYAAFGSHCDRHDFHGQVFAYDASTLALVGTFNTTPTGKQGGIWQAGRGLAADQNGNVFFMTGNGSVTSNSRGRRTNFGQSFIRLSPDLKNPDWWTDPNWSCYNAKDIDLDLGSSGPLLLTAPSGALADNRVIGGGKAGTFYLLSAMNLGHDSAPMSEIIATEPPRFAGIACVPGTLLLVGVSTHHIHGGPVLWNRSSAGGDILVYNMGEADNLKAFLVTNNRTRLVGPHAISKFRAPQHSMPGGILSLSHSDSADSGLVWALHPVENDANESIVEGMLTVFEARPTACVGGGCTPGVLDLRLLWHSKLSPEDDVGLFAKFTPATIADGKAFVASFGDPNWKDPVSGQNDPKTRPGWLHLYCLRSGTDGNCAAPGRN